MTWSFEISFFIFLIIVFISQGIATRFKSLIPMPLVLGLIAIIGFYIGVLPRDFIETSNMIVVGTIAYNLLVINGGTMINIGFLISRWKDSVICLVGALLVTLIVGFGLGGIIGKDLAMLSSGSVIGGGATCAIASYMMLASKAEIAVYPWMIFMFQGLFAVPIITWALKKEAKILLENYSSETMGANKSFVPKDNQKLKICEVIPNEYKTTAYYLVLIMVINVLNKWMSTRFNIGINQNATALILGFIFSQIGLIDVAPLNKSDSFGILLLGLMGLMMNTLAKNPIFNILRLLKPMVIAFIVTIAILIIISLVLSKMFKISPYGRIAMSINCLMGFPINQLLVKNAVSITDNDEEKEYLTGQLSPMLAVGTVLIVNTLSIIIIAVMVKFI